MTGDVGLYEGLVGEYRDCSGIGLVGEQVGDKTEETLMCVEVPEAVGEYTAGDAEYAGDVGEYWGLVTLYVPTDGENTFPVPGENTPPMGLAIGDIALGEYGESGLCWIGLKLPPRSRGLCIDGEDI